MNSNFSMMYKVNTNLNSNFSTSNVRNIDFNTSNNHINGLNYNDKNFNYNTSNISDQFKISEKISDKNLEIC